MEFKCLWRALSTQEIGHPVDLIRAEVIDYYLPWPTVASWRACKFSTLYTYWLADTNWASFDTKLQWTKPSLVTENFHGGCHNCRWYETRTHTHTTTCTSKWHTNKYNGTSLTRSPHHGECLLSMLHRYSCVWIWCWISDTSRSYSWVPIVPTVESSTILHT